MRKIFYILMVSFSLALSAQTTMGITYEEAKLMPAMRWSCPEIAKYQELLSSLKNDDCKLYANNVMEHFKPFEAPSSDGRLFLVTQAVLTVDNPLFNVDNLNISLMGWVLKQGWHKNLKFTGDDGKSLQTIASLNVASHSMFLHQNKVFVFPTLTFQLIEKNKLLVSFATDSYKYAEYSDHSKREGFTFVTTVDKVYPFVEKGSYKKSFAKAYVGTYQAFWNAISDLNEYLNTNFTKDTTMLAQLHYQYSMDSLCAKYGEPDKVIRELSKRIDINNEMFFFENASKIVFMGKTIDFEDVVSCEIVDDPKFIPGKSVTTGMGLSFYGIAFGGSETSRTPDKTIHNYVVDIKIDKLAIPFIRIAVGNNENKAIEIASVFDYILRRAEVVKQNTSTRRRM